MRIHKFNNLRIKHDGKEFLVYGESQYTIETDPETGDEAVFETAKVDEAIGFAGMVRDRQTLDAMEMDVLRVLNNDLSIARRVAASKR
jgi:hypothetical protein